MITTIKQYKSTCALFDFLDSLEINVSSNTWNIMVEDYGGFEPCDYCGEMVADCHRECDDASSGRYYAEYDDEASF